MHCSRSNHFHHKSIWLKRSKYLLSNDSGLMISHSVFVSTSETAQDNTSKDVSTSSSFHNLSLCLLSVHTVVVWLTIYKYINKNSKEQWKVITNSLLFYSFIQKYSRKYALRYNLIPKEDVVKSHQPWIKNVKSTNQWVCSATLSVPKVSITTAY